MFERWRKSGTYMYIVEEEAGPWMPTFWWHGHRYSELRVCVCLCVSVCVCVCFCVCVCEGRALDANFLVAGAPLLRVAPLCVFELQLH